MPVLPEWLIRQGLAVRSQMAAALDAQDAYLASLEAFDDRAESSAAGLATDPKYPPFNGCAHPASLRTDTTTGGGSAPSFFCRGCKHNSDELAAGASKVEG